MSVALVSTSLRNKRMPVPNDAQSATSKWHVRILLAVDSEMVGQNSASDTK